MLKEQLEVFFFSFCKHFTEQFQCIEGLEGLAQAVNMGSACVAQALERRDSKERIII